jgi:hypothetical protein
MDGGKNIGVYTSKAGPGGNSLEFTRKGSEAISKGSSDECVAFRVAGLHAATGKIVTERIALVGLFFRVPGHDAGEIAGPHRSREAREKISCHFALTVPVPESCP